MHRLTRSFVSSLIAAACLWPMTGAAHAQETAVLSVDQARGIFSAAGYEVDRAYTWDWTSPPVSTFQVRDQNDRVLMVLVYPSAEAAAAGRQEAESHDQTIQSGSAISGLGPHLVVGYGQSYWSGNVALVQSSQAQLQRMFQAQADRDSGVYGTSTSAVAEDPSLPTFAVDVDFEQALQNSVVNL
jgi:hypothetical protein